MVIDFPAGLFLAHQLAFGEHLDMSGDGLPAGIKMFGQGIWSHGMNGQQSQDRPAGRVGYGLENIPSGTFGFHYAIIWLQI
jgi:hypothetical protein